MGTWEKVIGTPPHVFVATGQNAVQQCEKDRKRKATDESKEWRKRASIC